MKRYIILIMSILLLIISCNKEPSLSKEPGKNIEENKQSDKITNHDKDYTTGNKENDKNIVVSIKEKIHSSLPEYTFNIYGQKKEQLFSANRIIVKHNKDVTVQEIAFEETETPDAEKLGLIIEDINFDGFKDIRIQQFLPAGSNIPYYYWLWDKEAAQYIQNKELEEITSPEIDLEHETIKSTARSNAFTYIEREYKFLEGVLTLVKETEKVANPDKNIWNITVRELKGKELKVTKTYSEPFKMSEADNGKFYSGTINGNLKIHMKLDLSKDNITGVYYYDNYKQDINLKGYISNKHFIVYEQDLKGTIEAIFISDDLIEGVWYDEKNTFPLYLIKEGSNLPSPQDPKSDLLKWNNSWEGINSGFYSGSELTIYPVFEDLIIFDISAFNGTHTGGLLSLALLHNDTAIFKGENDTYLKFTMKDNGAIVELDTNDYSNNCGMGVMFDSIYTNKELNIVPPTAKEQGLVYTDEQDKIFQDLTGEHYKELIQNAQLYTDDEDLDGLGFKVRKFGLRGYFNTVIVMINQNDNTILAAVEGTEAIYYFTNNKKYISPPDTIKNWCSEKYGTKIVTIEKAE